MKNRSAQFRLFHKHIFDYYFFQFFYC